MDILRLKGQSMSRVLVGTWGKSLAVRVPAEVARALNLREGEAVEIVDHNGDILLRRTEAKEDAQKIARAAADAIIADQGKFSLKGISIRELLEEGRRG